MLRSIFGKTLFENRRSMIWWIIGYVALAAYLIAFFPTVRDSPAMQDLALAKLDLLKGLLGSITSFGEPAGYMAGGLFSLMLPLMLLFFTVPLGANAIGGEEERKTIDMLLANPISRSRVVLEKFAAMTLLTIVLAAVMLLAFGLGGPGVGLIGDALTIGHLIAGLLSSVLLGLFFGTLALAVGAATGSRTIALSVAAALALINYLVKSMASTVESMATLQKALPMYYYWSDERSPLVYGLNWAHAGVLVAGIVVFLAAALITFNRRDVAI